MAKHESEMPERARKALNTIHEARETADMAVDNYIEAFFKSDEGSKRRRNAHIDMHKSVIRLYNRLRPYLVEAELHDNTFISHGERAFKYSTLAKWRTPSTTLSETQSRIGMADKTTEIERQIALPPEVCFGAYDALNEVIVKMEFGAEPGKDIDETSLDDKVDEVQDDDDSESGTTEAPA